MDISPKYEAAVRPRVCPRNIHVLIIVLPAKLAEETHRELMHQFKGRTLPPNHPLTRHIRRVATRILEASQLGTLDAPDVHKPQGAEDLWTFGGGSPDQLPPEVGGPKQWHLFVVNDDSVVNAMVSDGASTFRIMLKSVTWKWLVREHRGVHGNPTGSKG